VLEYLDNAEMETLYVTSTVHVPSQHDYTHAEIHPSCLFGIMGNQIVFPENSALPRNDYSCIQGRQSVSLYHSNYLNRIDNMGVLLDYGQKPIVKSRYTRYLNNEALPYGENAIVAIMTHTGYNVEDSILINESAVKRGLFHTTYYTMYETYEETGSLAGNSEKRIANVTKFPTTNLKPGYNYNELDEHGLIKVGTILTDKMVMIGRIQFQKESPDKIADASVFSSKGHTGIVDRVYLTENEEGKRIAKIRVREERTPQIGDKFSSRCGQKGTIGTLIPEENMPFTKDGIRPDLIINPHCMPSRMTINQLIECLFSKMAVQKGIAVDCTAFVNKGPKHEIVGGLLHEYGYHSSGNDLLYNGMTGELIESEIFMGPTYYLRLKHMVQDKINYRAGGPRVALTRQTNHGRSNDGGLKIGDMERDCILSHGMSAFMCDSMMKRGDAYQMAICNQSGSIAIYHRDTQQFYSPMVDGPLTFEKTETDTFTPSLITKYGKEFSKVDVPYCLKLLIHELTAMNIQMRLITSDNIENLTTYGKKTLGKFEDYVKKSEIFEQMTLEEKEALSRDIQSLKQTGTYTPLAEKQSRETILRAREELEKNHITPEDYRQILKMPITEVKPEPEPPPLKMEPELEELEEYNPIVEPEPIAETKSETKEPETEGEGEPEGEGGEVKKIVLAQKE
jgi:DNA-directed RNA polymerase beta subunit